MTRTPFRAMPFRFSRTLAAFAAGGLLAVAASHADLSLISASKAATNGTTPPASAIQAAPANAPAAAPLAALPDFSALVEQVGGAVVNISTVTLAKNSPVNGLNPNDPFYDFLRRFGIAPGMGSPQPQESRGIGSGFIVSPDGYVLTNAHVVADADEVVVKLTDKRDFKAKVVGIDRRSDVALIKISASNLPAVKIGSPERLKVGEWVAAIGAPFGFENSVTAGIVSAKSRALPDETYVPFIQTDVAINPGNSGGPLFNLKGEVVGINSQIYSRSGGYQGISFAIPIDVAMKVKEQLQKTGKVQRGRLGVTMQPVTKELAESFGLEKPNGALVTGVDRGSPADKAGLQPGDVIVALDGVALEEATDLPRKVGDSAPGTKLSLTLLRDGKRLEKQATLAAMPNETTARSQEAPAGGRIGLAVRPLSKEESAALGTSGVVVVGVNGPAARAGLQEGDVVLAVNNTRVATPAQLKELVDQGGKRFALLVQRGDARLYVPVRVD
ncbi:serine protease [Azospira sp. I13]|uniref:DegQ family serine endoprotease n=1 Tax=Azospira sp. I13 TaxID=1765050 RepID=UPI000D4F81F0|nr:DegQ family serine endoprotease [Azospira sp. I13]GBG02438.1 serine protease [Azospira sp. I13]